MDITIVDGDYLRLAQAATDPKGIHEVHRVIRLEPGGRMVATDFLAMVIIEDAVVPFQGEAVHIVPERRIPPSAGVGAWVDGSLTFPKAEMAAPQLDVQYPNYEPMLARKQVEVPRVDYDLEVGHLHALVSSLPGWPKSKRVRVRHLSDRSITLDTGVPGATVLISLAGEGR